METIWGLVMVGFSLLAWGGQAISWLRPDRAVRWNLMEAEASVEPVYWADVRGEAVWDSLSLWTLAVAGVLLLVDQPAWAYFGLVGGGMYVYFAGRGILTRMEMQRHGYRVGSEPNVRLGYGLLTVWGVVGLITILVAIGSLPTT